MDEGNECQTRVCDDRPHLGIDRELMQWRRDAVAAVSSWRDTTVESTYDAAAYKVTTKSNNPVIDNLLVQDTITIYVKTY